MKKGLFVTVLSLCLLFGGIGVYAGTVIKSYKTVRGNIATVEREDIHKNRIGLVVDGKSVKSDTWYANGTTYIPLREVSTLLGSSVTYDSATQTAKITSKGGETTTPQSPTNLSQTINGVTVGIDKVVQDSDSLKIYVTYINGTNDKIMTGDSLSKIVANGTQFEYDSDFNFDRWYETGVPHAADFIESGVTEQSVIFFSPVSSDTINIVLNAEWEDYRFNTVKVEK